MTGISSNESETNNVEPPEVKLTAPDLSNNEKTEEITVDSDLSNEKENVFGLTTFFIRHGSEF
ncbi:hypothetical protein [Iningainema tapete]|uniref:Uncharacterized protein n=1 Tax=Iningainema tapete BLCC-T55 TaxID=2748662 RepID=A0A8J6XQ74_9CYAN|nr:hypothetical protein [Iningainema tapete]MBD2775356.1 hypothetical protein [Iningainema tapete BLCC-T55]